MSKLKYYTRKTHRYLGLLIGIQLLLWSVGGLYFSWTDIDKIHGDHLVNFPETHPIIDLDIIAPAVIFQTANIKPSEIAEVKLVNTGGKTSYRLKSGKHYYLFDAKTGQRISEFSKEEAADFAKDIFKPRANINKVEWVTEENIRDHWQYRGGILPAWAVSFNHPSKSVLYLSSEKRTFEKIRNQQWRIFDYLWMLHIMDFNEREDINNIILRTFSVLSLLTIISGFALFYQSSRTLRKAKKRFKRKPI